MSGWELARSDILTLRGYRAAEQITDSVRLNANEAPRPIAAGNAGDGLNRYPEVHPVQLQERLASLFSVPGKNLLVTRGSSEGIDLLLRAFCSANQDNVITPTPTFEMYRFFADVQGVEQREIELSPEQDFLLDTGAVLEKCDDKTKLIFVCSPNNPTGGLVPNSAIEKLLEARRDRSIVVVDEAYVEFSDQPSLAAATGKYDNLVVLRTLSKAHALAGARCGAAIACPDLIDVFCRVLPPYSFPTPVIDSVMNTLNAEGAGNSAAAIEEIIVERDRLCQEMEIYPYVKHIWPSQANFLLVKISDMADLQKFLLGKRILIRDFSNEPRLQNCARITIGSVDDNNALLNALASYSGGA